MFTLFAHFCVYLLTFISWKCLLFNIRIIVVLLATFHYCLVLFTILPNLSFYTDLVLKYLAVTFLSKIRYYLCIVALLRRFLLLIVCYFHSVHKLLLDLSLVYALPLSPFITNSPSLVHSQFCILIFFPFFLGYYFHFWP